MSREIIHLMENLESLIPETIEKLSDEFLICECFCVSAGDIRGLYTQGKPSVEQLIQVFGLGTGCQGCLNRKDDWINKLF